METYTIEAHEPGLYGSELEPPRFTQMGYDGVSLERKGEQRMFEQDSSFTRPPIGHWIANTQLVGELPTDGGDSWESDPYRYARSRDSEAGGVWAGELPPNVGPTLGRAGAFVPLYPEPLPPHLFKPEKQEVTEEALLGGPQSQGNVFTGVSIGTVAREANQPGFTMLMKNDETPGYTNGMLMTDRTDQLTDHTRFMYYTPQGNVPILYPEEGADAAKHRQSAEKPALLGLFVEAKNARIRDYRRRPEKGKAAGADGVLVEPEVKHNTMRQFLSVLGFGGALGYTQLGEAERGKVLQPKIRSNTFTPACYAVADHGLVAPAEPVRPGSQRTGDRSQRNLQTVSFFGPSNTSVYQHQATAGRQERAKMLELQTMKQRADTAAAGNPTLDTAGTPSIFNTEHVFTYDNTMKAFTSDAATPAGPLSSITKGDAAEHAGRVSLDKANVKIAAMEAYSGAPTIDMGLTGKGPNAGREAIHLINPAVAIRQATQHGAAGNPGNSTYGTPAYYNTKVVGRAGDLIKANLAKYAWGGAPLLNTNSATDSNVNPRDMPQTNRTITPIAVRAAAPTASMEAPQYASLGEMESRKVTRPVSDLPDLSLMSALDTNPFVPVQLRPCSRASSPVPH